MSSNFIGPLPKEYNNTSEKVRKKVGIWMIPKSYWYLLLTRFPKNGILKWYKKSKKNLMW